MELLRTQLAEARTQLEVQASTLGEERKARKDVEEQAQARGFLSPLLFAFAPHWIFD